MYLHEPYTARNYVPWATFFVADSIWVALQVFEQLLQKTSCLLLPLGHSDTDTSQGGVATPLRCGGSLATVLLQIFS